MTHPAFRCTSARIVQVCPVPPGWAVQVGVGEKERREPLAFVALVEMTLESDDWPDGPWTGREILPVDDSFRVMGLPDDGYYFAHALGDGHDDLFLVRADDDE